VDRTARYVYINAREYGKGQSIMDNPQKLAT
jgi:phosphosulfolactate synthase (CoM biosynthesis protein A)